MGGKQTFPDRKSCYFWFRGYAIVMDSSQLQFYHENWRTLYARKWNLFPLINLELHSAKSNSDSGLPLTLMGVLLRASYHECMTPRQRRFAQGMLVHKVLPRCTNTNVNISLNWNMDFVPEYRAPASRLLYHLVLIYSVYVLLKWFHDARKKVVCHVHL